MSDENDQNSSNRFLSDQDAKLWEAVTKDVKPLRKTVPKTVQRQVKNDNPKQHNSTLKSSINQYEPRVSEENHGSIKQDVQVDKRTAERLRRGKIPIEGRLDLHGLSQSQAYEALLSFVRTAYHGGKRCVIVVTGKGMARHGDVPIYKQTIGVLKQKTPIWLSENVFRQYVLKVEQARPEHGGGGALYVLIRRKR
ncbi:MAG: Smr/MutS family protein [Alphaproteobacteria bacterium]